MPESNVQVLVAAMLVGEVVLVRAGFKIPGPGVLVVVMVFEFFDIGLLLA